MAEKAPKKIPEHRDKLGCLLEVGGYVAYPAGNTLNLGMITKLNPKMVKVSRLGKGGWRNESNKYPTDLVVVSGPHVTMYVLKNSA